MRRLVLVLVPVLLVGVGCRGEASRPNVDQQFSNVESTLDAIDSDLAGD